MHFSQYGNKCFKLISTYPLLHHQDYYVIRYEEYSLFHFLRRTTANKYEIHFTIKLLCVDLSSIHDKKEYIQENWSTFVTQAMQHQMYSMNKLQTMIAESNPTTLFDTEGKMNLYTIYSDNSQDYLLEFSSLFEVYAALLLRLDTSPLKLGIYVDSGYDNLKNDIKSSVMYNATNFNNDLFVKKDSK